MTGDGLSAITWIEEKIYLLVTHSGITLATAVSNIAAEEIMTGSENSTLAPFSATTAIEPTE